jgi:MFS family permease
MTGAAAVRSVERGREQQMKTQHPFKRFLSRNFRGLWRLADFRKLWVSLTITAFGAQITNLALPLTAALLLHATPLQMGILVALETLPFALFSLHTGVLLDRVRKLPIVITSDVSRGVALLSIPLAAYFDRLSMELLFVVGFFCGAQNVVGGAGYQVLLAQLAGRKRLVEANAKISLGETGSALVGPGFAGILIQALTAPFAIVLDALAFIGCAFLLKGLKVPNDVPSPPAKGSMWAEIHEGLLLVWRNRTLLALAVVAGLWQVLHHMQVAVLILFATRDLSLSAGAIGIVYMCGGLGCVIAAALAERLAQRFGIGPVIVYSLTLTAVAWQAFGLVQGPPGVALIALGLAMLVFDFGAVLYGINYLALRQAITPDRLLGRMTATMRFLTVAAAPLGSLAGGVLATIFGLRSTLLVIGALGLGLAALAIFWSPVRTHRRLPMVVAE